jgi:hypothetical protein
VTGQLAGVIDRDNSFLKSIERLSGNLSGRRPCDNHGSGRRGGGEHIRHARVTQNSLTIAIEQVAPHRQDNQTNTA